MHNRQVAGKSAFHTRRGKLTATTDELYTDMKHKPDGVNTAEKRPCLRQPGLQLTWKSCSERFRRLKMVLKMSDFIVYP